MRWQSLFSILLSGFLAIPQAQGRSLHNMSPERVVEVVRNVNYAGLPRAFQGLRSLEFNKANEAIVKLAQSRPVEMSADLGRTILFLLTITGVELVREEIMARVRGEVSDKDLAEMAVIAAKQIVDSGSTYVAILSAGVAHLGLKYPTQAITAWMIDPTSRPILQASLASSILATGGLAGWELGVSLWNEASYLLETTEEFERSKTLFGTGAGAFKALIYSSKSRDAKDLALVQTMARNMIYVAWSDQELRSKWIDNTWRTRFMDGDVAILTAALVAAGIGTLFLPGGGTAVGYMLGLAAVVIAISLPDSLKHSITRGLHQVRISVQLSRMQTAERVLRNSVNMNMGTRFSMAQRMKWIDEGIAWRRSLRSSYLTINLERARLIFKELFSKHGYPGGVDQASLALRGIFGELHNFFLAQLEATRKINEAAKGAPNEILSKIQDEQERILSMAQFFNVIGMELYDLKETSFKSMNPRVQEYVKFIEIGYSRGFDEESALQ
jgi:hypothetical protein